MTPFLTQPPTLPEPISVPTSVAPLALAPSVAPPVASLLTLVRIL